MIARCENSSVHPGHHWSIRSRFDPMWMAWCPGISYEQMREKNLKAISHEMALDSPFAAQEVFKDVYAPALPLKEKKEMAAVDQQEQSVVYDTLTDFGLTDGEAKNLIKHLKNKNVFFYTAETTEAKTAEEAVVQDFVKMGDAYHEAAERAVRRAAADKTTQHGVINTTSEQITIAQMADAAVKDMVQHPAHYTDGEIEVWDYILDKQLSYCSGNVVKYISRAGKKDKSKHIEDLEKAQAYLAREIKRVKEGVSELSDVVEHSVGLKFGPTVYLDQQARIVCYWWDPDTSHFECSACGNFVAHEGLAAHADRIHGTEYYVYDQDRMRVRQADAQDSEGEKEKSLVRFKWYKRNRTKKNSQVQCGECYVVTFWSKMENHVKKKHPEFAGYYELDESLN